MRSTRSINDDIFNSSSHDRDNDESRWSEQQYERHSNEDSREGRCHGQKHTHEYLGSVKVAEISEDPHNHRFAGVTGEAISFCGKGHFHKLKGNTDFYEDHFHMADDETGPAIPVGNGKHVHFVKGNTTLVDGHRHEFQFATLIDNPIGD